MWQLLFSIMEKKKMLEKSLKYITVGKEKYPIICTMNTLEYIQDKYGSIQKWQRLTSGVAGESENPEYTPINVAAMMDGFTAMVNEGIDVINWKDPDGGRENITRQQAGMIIREAGLSLTDAAMLVLNALTECIVGKNPQTAQSNQGATKKRRLTLRGFCMSHGLYSAFRKKKPDTCSSGNI